MSLLLLGGSSGIVRAGLVNGFRLDEGSGQSMDDLSANGFDGQLGSTSGSDATDPTWVTEGLEFDGSDDFCSRGGEATLGNFHIITIFLIDDVSVTRTLVGRWGLAGSRSWLLQILGTDVLQIATSIGGTIDTVSTGNTASVATWYWAEAWYDGSTIRVRLTRAGSPASASRAGSVDNAGTWAMGHNEDGPTARFDGKIAYYLEYDRVLTDGEVTKNFNAIRRQVAGRGITIT